MSRAIFMLLLIALIPATAFGQIGLAFEWRYTPGQIPRTFVTLGDPDKVTNNLLVQQARSIGRIEGSRYPGRDFIEGEPRQAFQDNFNACHDRSHFALEDGDAKFVTRILGGDDSL